VAPFCDGMLAERCQQAIDDWMADAHQQLEANEDHERACQIITAAREKLDQGRLVICSDGRLI
jgi:hypothetical protein